MGDQDLQKRYIDWLGYWCEVIRMQHSYDQDAQTHEGPLYRDDADRAINGIIVATLLDCLDGLEQQFIRGTSK